MTLSFQNKAFKSSVWIFITEIDNLDRYILHHLQDFIVTKIESITPQTQSSDHYQPLVTSFRAM
jgi:hypothetical protein